MPNTFRSIAMIACVLATSAVSQAQSAPANAPAASSDPGTRVAPTPPPPQQERVDPGAISTSDVYAHTGGSLMRASRGVQASADQGAGDGGGRVANNGFYGVPPPQPRVIRPHDLVTVIIQEQSQFKSEGTSKLDKKASLEAAINQFIKLNLANTSLENSIGGVAPEIDLEGNSKFDGKGSAERKDSLSVRMQAMVVDVKPNGTLVLAARRRIKTEAEERVFRVSGIARVEDVTTDNTILSTQLYDFDLQQDTKGTVTEATKRGWLPRLLDAVNPF